MSENMEKPNDRLNVVVNDKPVELFMSAGLIRRLVTRTMTSGEDIHGLYFNVPLQSELMLEALRPRTEHGNPKVECGLDDFIMTIEDGEKVTTWITEHILYFFVKSATRLQKDLTSPEALLQKLMGSPTGTEASPVGNASAGPTNAG